MAKQDPLEGPVFYTGKMLEPLHDEYCVAVVKHIHQRMHPRYSILILALLALYILLLWLLLSYDFIALDVESGIAAAGAALFTLAPAFVVGFLYGSARGWSEIAAVFRSGGLLYAKKKYD
jgi:hypothetical protein